MPTRATACSTWRIAEASGNAVLTRVVTELYDERHNPLFAQLGSHFENIASWRLAIAEHQAVVRCHRRPRCRRRAPRDEPPPAPSRTTASPPRWPNSRPPRRRAASSAGASSARPP
jgi:hypothetical protein